MRCCRGENASDLTCPYLRLEVANYLRKVIILYHYLDHPRFQWFFDTPNQCAAVFAMFAIIAAGIFLFFSTKIQPGQSPNKKRILVLLSILSLNLCVLLEYFLVITYSRGGYLALFCAFMLLFFLSGRKRALLLPGIAFFLLMIIPCGVNRISGIANFADASIGNRIELWKGALAMSADYWMSGVGFGFGGPFLKMFSAWYQPLWMHTFYNTAVCDYLSLSAKGGIFLLFGYLSLIFSILFAGYQVYLKKRNFLLAGLICAQIAYLIAGIFSTFFNIYSVIIPFLSMQFLTLLVVLIYLLKEKDFSILKKVYIPLAMAVTACAVLLLFGMYFRSKIATRYELTQLAGVREVLVIPRGKEANGIILYLFDSGRKSLEEEARLTLRPLAEKGFIVISEVNKGGFKGLEQAQIVAKKAIQLGRNKGLPVMFAGQGEGGRFAVICAAKENDNTDFQGKAQALKAVAVIGSSATWPFPELSPHNSMKSLNIPFLVLHGAQDNAIPVTEAEQFLAEAKKHNKQVKSVIIPEAPHYLGKNRIDALTKISSFFLSTLSAEKQKKIRLSRMKFIDFEKALPEQIQGARGWIFGGRICPRCDYLKGELLPELLQKSIQNEKTEKQVNPEEINWDSIFIFVDLDKPENVMLLMALEDRLGVTGEKTPVLLWNNMLYYGNDAIAEYIAYSERNIPIDKKIQDILSGKYKGNKKNILAKKASELKFPLIVTAGLIDGINPCVFSTLIFFMSILAISKIKGKKLMLTGVAYCLSCFLTYLLLGFGALYMLKLFTGFSFMSFLVNLLTMVLLLSCALISFRDAWAYSRSKDPKSVKLQLPDNIKNKIHSIFRKGMAFKFLIPGACFMGFIVTLFESLCTGQVYVPILVLLAKESFLSKWLFYLIIYNLMFILPLIIIFWMAFCGVTVSGFIKLSKKNVVFSKLLLGFLFLALAGLVLAIG